MRKHLLAGALALTLALPCLVLATDVEDYTGLSATGTAAFGELIDERRDLPMFIGTYIIAPVTGVVGLVFFVFMLYGGVMWMTAGGNPEQVKKSQTIMRNGVIGLFFIIAAYAITNAVLNALTSGSITP